MRIPVGKCVKTIQYYNRVIGGIYTNCRWVFLIVKMHPDVEMVTCGSGSWYMIPHWVVKQHLTCSKSQYIYSIMNTYLCTHTYIYISYIHTAHYHVHICCTWFSFAQQLLLPLLFWLPNPKSDSTLVGQFNGLIFCQVHILRKTTRFTLHFLHNIPFQSFSYPIGSM